MTKVFTADAITKHLVRIVCCFFQFLFSMSAGGVLLRKAAAVQSLRRAGVSDAFVLLLDFDHFRQGLRDCSAAFPAHWRHCFAIKANPTRLVLAEAASLGFGFEAASLGELRMASRASASSDTFVVYDSPLKNEQEIRDALQRGAFVNVDNLQELDVLAHVLDTLGGPAALKNGVGIRVNPQVGAGTLAGFSTGTATSKFGIGLTDDEGLPVLEAYRRFPWLTGIMCHIGSQGVPFDLAVRGIRATVEFALRVNRDLKRNQITTIDIGGGMSVNFGSDERTPDFKDYAAALRASVPELFDESQFSRVVTEFGRALVAKSGFFASRVEYVKTTGGRRIAIQYAGADTCVRTVYHPKEWPLRLSLLDKDLKPYGGEGFTPVDTKDYAETDIAGPCCIQADIVAHQRPLPPINRGDTVLLHDVGGYYHSGHTRYNLRQAPAVYSFEGNSNDSLSVKLLQPGETVDETLDAFCEPEFRTKK